MHCINCIVPDNCATGMGESQYSYQGLPDPTGYFTGNVFICDNNMTQTSLEPGPGGLQTPNTRARRVVHEVIV